MNPLPEHPLGCGRGAADSRPVHTVEIGTIETCKDCGEFVGVALNQVAADRAPVVTVTLSAAGCYDVVLDLTPGQAVALAGRLQRAAEILLDSWAQALAGGESR